MAVTNATDSALDDWWRKWMVLHRAKGLTATWRKLWTDRRTDDMQKEFTIQIRIDYADKGKDPVMRKAVQTAARHLYATGSLLVDEGMKPRVTVYSDDFLTGFEDIPLFDDTIQAGVDQLNALSPGLSETEDHGVSNELLEAMRTK